MKFVPSAKNLTKIFAGLFVVWTLLVFVSPFVIPLDHFVHDFFLKHPFWLAAQVQVTRLGDARFLLPLIFIVSVVLYFAKKNVEGFGFFGLASLALLSNVLLKELFGRSRPQFYVEGLPLTSLSYPSGHALGSVLLAAFLIFMWDQTGWLYPKKIIKGLIGMLGLWVALSRIFLGVHWMSDVVGGLLYGLIWVSLWRAYGRLYLKSR